MSYAKAKNFDPDLIPIIDITSLRNGKDSFYVSKLLQDASKRTGFIYVQGHGIQRQTIENARHSALKFFRSTADDKSTVQVTTTHRGWLGQKRSKMQDDAKADLKESFIWGHESEPDNLPKNTYVYGTNKWPKFQPDFQKHATNYFNEVQKVAHHLLRGFAIGLNLQENFFLRNCSQPLSRASYVYYPQQPVDLGENQFGAGPHTDFGLMTVLCQDAIGGLQIKNINGDWVHAPPVEGSLIVNVGDLLSRWTDGIYRSTMHRVVNTSGHERLSLVFAFDPNYDTVIDAHEIFGSNYKTKEDPIRCGEYLEWRFNRAFS